jgi:hypothetical protein
MLMLSRYACLLIFCVATIGLSACDSGDQKYRRIRNETAAIDRLKTVHTLEARYASAHSGGFTCDLAQLSSNEPVGNWKSATDLQILHDLLNTGVNHGYRFTLRDCVTGPDGRVEHYRAVAVPSIPSNTGIRAFCTDESGAMWVDLLGSPADCVRNRKPLD